MGQRQSRRDGEHNGGGGGGGSVPVDSLVVDYYCDEIQEEPDNDLVVETSCIKSFSDNNLAWYVRPLENSEAVPAATTPIETNRKLPPGEALSSPPQRFGVVAAAADNDDNADASGRPHSTCRSQSSKRRDRPASGLFRKPPSMSSWFSRLKASSNTALASCADQQPEMNPNHLGDENQRRAVRPVTIVGSPMFGTTKSDKLAYRSAVAAAAAVAASRTTVNDKVVNSQNALSDLAEERRSDGTIIDELLRQTVEFLVHEIEPVLIAEYLKRQRRSRRRTHHHDAQGKQTATSPSNGDIAHQLPVASDVIVKSPTIASSPPPSSSSPVLMSEREMRALLADIILGGPEDTHRSRAAADEDLGDAAGITVRRAHGHGGSSTPSMSSASPSGAAPRVSPEDEFWTFCYMLRKLDADRKSGEFLEALGAVLRIVMACRCSQCGGRTLDCSPPSSPGFQSSSEQDGELWPADRSTSTRVPDSDEEFDIDDGVSVSGAVNGRRRRRQFDVRIVYVDSDKRVTRSFDDVVELKRSRRHKSRAGLVAIDEDQQQPQPHQAVVVMDTADRYVPMLVVRVSGVDTLCETRTRRVERLLEDFPDRIHHLTIANVDLDPSSTLRLSRAVERHPTSGLHTLRVIRSSLGNDGATLLAAGLTRNTALRSLSLAGNGLTSRGCVIIVRALLRPSATALEGGGGCARIGLLAELDLADNPGIGDSGCRSVASVLQSTGCRLQKLSLRRTGIGPSGADELFAALRRNARLSVLDLGGNHMIDGGRSKTVVDSAESVVSAASAVVRLAESLIVNRTLRELFLDDDTVGLTPAECGELARVLRTNTALVRLRLDGNPSIGDLGAELLADGLRYNRGVLQELGLAGCSVGDHGLRAIVDATTAFNSSVKLIDLRSSRRIGSRFPTTRSDAADSKVPDRDAAKTGRDDENTLFGGASKATAAGAGTSQVNVNECPTTNGVSEIKSPGSVMYFNAQLVSVVEGLVRPQILIR